MKFQLALDFVDIKEAKQILREVSDIIDIIEIGTPFIMNMGMKAITEIKAVYPSIELLADLKIMDAGAHEAKMAFDAGADIITVLGAADNDTIRAALKEAEKYGKKLLVDMISLADIRKRTMEIDQMGVDYICFYTAFDVQGKGKNPIMELQEAKQIIQKAKTAVAGGINADTLKQIIPFQPDIIIVGGAVTGRQDIRKAALEIRRILEQP